MLESGLSAHASLMALLNRVVRAALLFVLGMVIIATVAVVHKVLGIGATLLNRPQGRPGSGDPQNGAWVVDEKISKCPEVERCGPSSMESHLIAF